MIELPEAVVLAGQLNKKLKGRKILRVIAANSPHKFAWYSGDPKNYEALLKGKFFKKALSAGGMVEINVDDTSIVLSDGVSIKYHSDSNELPKKHQLLIEFDNSAFLTASVQMYGGILCFIEGKSDNKYYLAAKAKPSPVMQKFNEKYFSNMISEACLQNKSAKFLLATEQRIPGLGNGVLQDILLEAKIHPKTKLETLSKEEKNRLFHSIKIVLLEMIEKGGRDTEKDLFGSCGGYITKLSKNTAGKPCPNCGSIIKKENYMGGSIYYCGNCQKLN